MAAEHGIGKRYGAAVFAAAAALALHSIIQYASKVDEPSLVVLCLGIVIASHLGGTGPGLLATGLLSIGAAFFNPEPIRLMVFGLVGVVISVLGGALHRWRHVSRAERRARELAELAKHQAQDAAAQRLRMIVDNAYDAFVAIDRTGRVIDWNPQARETFGWTREEATGKPFVELVVPPQHRELFAGAVGGPERRRMELTALHRDGREFPAEMTISPVGAGENVFFAAFIHDISDRRAAEATLAEQRKELERSNEELQQFAYVASHDLQEPLRMVASYTQLLSRRYKGKLGPDADEFIHFAVDGAQRMQTLINDLLAYSRVGTRGKPFEPVDTNDVMSIVKANLKVAIEETNAEIVVHGTLPTVEADRSQLIQLFQNLVGNAIKFHGEALPRVEVAAERVEDEKSWRFTVKDNGIGIDPEHHERIFVIFQRLHTREHYQGTGIGLAVCRKIVERHGGKIRVDSQDGHGSTFTFTIPDKEMQNT